MTRVAYVPHEIHVLAPTDRLRRVREDLLAGDGATGFTVLCDEPGIARDEILFNHRTLHAVDLDRADDFAFRPGPAKAGFPGLSEVEGRRPAAR